MPHSLYTRVALALMLAVVAGACVFGGRAERRGAGLIAGGWIAVLLAQPLAGRLDPAVALTVIDAAVFVGFMALTWRARSIWPLWAAVCQGLSLAVHAIRFFSPRMPAWTYLTALAVPSYLLLAVLAAGTIAAWRERRRQGLSS